RIYDAQAQRDLTTALDHQPAIELQVRDAAVYFTPYAPAPPGTIQRFDSDNNSITTVFTVPGFLPQNASSGWELSADGGHVLSRVDSTGPCSGTGCYVYQDTSGTVTTLFPDYSGHSLDSYMLAPDGRYAAGIVGWVASPQAGPDSSKIVQQGAPTGSELTNALPVTGSAAPNEDGLRYRPLGWTPGETGILVSQAEIHVSVEHNP